MRHGARAPIATFPTDPYDVTFWPNGWGQLTDVSTKVTISSVVRISTSEKFETGEFKTKINHRLV